MAENSGEDLSKKIKKIPIEKIKVPLAIFCIMGLIGVITISFIHGLNQPKLSKSAKPKKSSEKYLAPKTSDIDVFKDGYGIEAKEESEISEDEISDNNYREPTEQGNNRGYYNENQQGYGYQGYQSNSYEDSPQAEEERAYEEFKRKFEEDRVETRIKARHSQIDFYKPEDVTQQASTNPNYGNGNEHSQYTANNEYQMQNNQSNKNQFRRQAQHSSFANSYNQEYADDYTLKAGGIIPTVLISGINSDLPSDVIAQVREDVYDTVSGNYLLLPKGARLIGTYDSGVTYGQERLLLVWQRIVFPNGKSIGLDNFNGVDMSGFAGVTGKVNNHFGKLLESVVLSSVLGAGSAIITKDDNSNSTTWKEGAGQGAGNAILEVGSKIADKTLNIQPTITVRQGSRMNIMINSDLKLTPYRR